MKPPIVIEYEGWSESERKVLDGLREDHAVDNAPIVRRTCGGRLVSRARRGGTKIRVSISKSGPRTWIPYDLDIGSPVRLHSSLWYTAPAPRSYGSSVAGYVDLSRATRLSGSIEAFVAARSLDGDLAQAVVDYQTENRAFVHFGDVVLFRPVLETGVVRFDTGGSATDLEQSFTLELLEI